MVEKNPDLQNPLALEHQVCFSLAVASRTVIALYRPVLAPLGLTHPQYLVMLALWQFAPLSVRELAELLELDSATLSPLLKRLEAAGLILRERLPEDERRLTVGLTRAGRDLRARAEAIPMHMMEKLGLSLEELQELNATLGRVTSKATLALAQEERT
ncbi:MarR family transcriptional regulator [Nocardiopsis sp. EMB25]|uniref:MarR family winged helix-turn-helix transcriptional regulator n=1 Tax=Nocardiopsis TaxID=2013 RepID=UPI0003479CC3|nr:MULTISPECIES: MarR family transcriptional regulator [Nocardiopsis]MCY9787082.1 MarR family transcriptional regulator [Nocardiopsis sp. EMB25]